MDIIRYNVIKFFVFLRKFPVIFLNVIWIRDFSAFTLFYIMTTP